MATKDGFALNPLPLKNPQGGALSLTRVSGFGAGVAALLTAINPTWNKIFGAHTPLWAKPVFMMVVVAAWALIAAADIFARGYAKGKQQVQIVAIPLPLPATDTRGVDTPCRVIAARSDPAKPDAVEFLISTQTKGAEWVASGDLSFQ